MNRFIWVIFTLILLTAHCKSEPSLLMRKASEAEKSGGVIDLAKEIPGDWTEMYFAYFPPDEELSARFDNYRDFLPVRGTPEVTMYIFSRGRKIVYAETFNTDKAEGLRFASRDFRRIGPGHFYFVRKNTRFEVSEVASEKYLLGKIGKRKK